MIIAFGDWVFNLGVCVRVLEKSQLGVLVYLSRNKKKKGLKRWGMPPRISNRLMLKECLRLALFPDAPLANANATQGPDGPLPSFRYP